jgi:hypothetical protein
MLRSWRISPLFSTERRLPKLDVAGSIPVSRSIFSSSCDVSIERPDDSFSLQSLSEPFHRALLGLQWRLAVFIFMDGN